MIPELPGTQDLLFLRKNNIWAIPVIHYNMEMAAQVRLAFNELKPDCVAVELAETMQLQLLHAASRLPDIGIVVAYDKKQDPLYYLCEPCDGAFEGLRSALEAQVGAYCIDLDVDYYPNVHEHVPDPYAIGRIGLKNYYEAYRKFILSKDSPRSQIDEDRELYMAKRLKELSLRYEKVLFVGGMTHVERVLELSERNSFPIFKPAERESVQLCTLTELSCRDVMAEYGWISSQYEHLRQDEKDFPPDRQKLIYALFKEAIPKYVENTGNDFPGYNLRNLMKFLRNYALIQDKLLPDLYQILSGAKGCVDHNYAYEVWEVATEYPFRRNVDNLQELDLSIDDVWGHSKHIQFQLKLRNPKSDFRARRHKQSSKYAFNRRVLSAFALIPLRT